VRPAPLACAPSSLRPPLSRQCDRTSKTDQRAFSTVSGRSGRSVALKANVNSPLSFGFFKKRLHPGQQCCQFRGHALAPPNLDTVGRHYRIDITTGYAVPKGVQIVPMPVRSTKLGQQRPVKGVRGVPFRNINVDSLHRRIFARPLNGEYGHMPLKNSACLGPLALIDFHVTGREQWGEWTPTARQRRDSGRMTALPSPPVTGRNPPQQGQRSAARLPLRLRPPASKPS
jgi:hypothetical protein